jgi:hypothetical protein
MKQSIYIFIIVSIITCSCKPLSETGNKRIGIEQLNNTDFQALNSTYSFNYDTIFGKIKHDPYDGLSDHQRISLLNQLFRKFPKTAWRDENNQVIDPREKWIKIEFLSARQARISFYHNDRFVFSGNIHGKFKYGYFYLRPKMYVVPLIPLVFGYHFERTRIGKTRDDRLLIDHSINRWLFALVSGSKDNGVVTTIFKKR